MDRPSPAAGSSTLLAVMVLVALLLVVQIVLGLTRAPTVAPPRQDAAPDLASRPNLDLERLTTAIERLEVLLADARRAPTGSRDDAGPGVSESPGGSGTERQPSEARTSSIEPDLMRGPRKPDLSAAVWTTDDRAEHFRHFAFRTYESILHELGPPTSTSIGEGAAWFRYRFVDGRSDRRLLLKFLDGIVLEVYLQ